MRPALVIALVNCAILLTYAFFERDLPFDSRWARGALIGVALGSILSVLVAKSLGKRIFSFAVNAQLSLLACLMVFVLIEALFVAAPNIFPDNIRRLIQAGPSFAGVRERVVELLPYSPYAKPRANTKIHIPGYYGPKDSFVYHWTTDRRGFKNTDSIAARETVDIVASGDSFTEGMGVTVEDTWTSKLSQLGYPAYSLGVQGYAPTQFRGAYEHYGRALSPKWVVIGYTSEVYRRDSYFKPDMENKRASQELPSAIGRLVERDELEQKQHSIYLETKDGYRVPLIMRYHHTFVTSAIVTLARYTLNFALFFDAKAGTPPDDPRFISDRSLQQGGDFQLKLMARYRGEFASIASSAYANVDPVQLSQDPLWLSAEREFEQIITMARQDGAKTLFLFFPGRAAAYYERATGHALPPNNSDVAQAVLVARFARQNGADMIDMTPVFRSYVAKLTEKSPIEEYPYLRIDGHPSAKGHELIAAEVARFLSTRESAKR